VKDNFLDSYADAFPDFKGDLVGRVVGYEYPHQPHPSHIKPGRTPRLKRTIWGRVYAQIHRQNHVMLYTESGEIRGCQITDLHTIMPETY